MARIRRVPIRPCRFGGRSSFGGPFVCSNNVSTSPNLPVVVCGSGLRLPGCRRLWQSRGTFFYIYTYIFFGATRRTARSLGIPGRGSPEQQETPALRHTLALSKAREDHALDRIKVSRLSLTTGFTLIISDLFYFGLASSARRSTNHSLPADRTYDSLL
jgi:hypothetical protein